MRERVAFEALDVLGEDTDFLSKVAGFDGVCSYHFFLFELDVLDVLLVLLFFASPLIESKLCFSQVFFEVVDQSSVMLLLILKSLCMLLLSLPRVKSKIS